jgi:hypothetical protein
MIGSLFFITTPRKISFLNPIITKYITPPSSGFKSKLDHIVISRNNNTNDFNVILKEFKISLKSNKNNYALIHDLSIRFKLVDVLKSHLSLEEVIINNANLNIKIPIESVNFNTKSEELKKGQKQKNLFLPKVFKILNSNIMITKEDKAIDWRIDNTEFKLDKNVIVGEVNGNLNNIKNSLKTNILLENNDSKILVNFSDFPITPLINLLYPKQITDNRTNLFVTGSYNSILENNTIKEGLLEIENGKGQLINAQNQELLLDSVKAKAVIKNSGNEVNIEKLVLAKDKTFLEVEGRFIKDQADTGLIDTELQVRLEAFPFNFIKDFWPSSLAPSAREWVTTRIKDGTVSKAGGKFVIKPKYILDKHFPKDSITAQVELLNAKLNYYDGLPIIENIKASAKFDSEKIYINANGKAKNSVISDAYIEVPFAENKDLIITGKAHGGAQDIIAFIPEPKIKAIKDEGFQVDKISGITATNVKINIPLKDDINFADLKFDIKSSMDNVRFPAILKNHSLSHGKFNVLFNGKNLNIEGHAKFDESIDANISWIDNLTDNAQADKLKISAILNQHNIANTNISEILAIKKGSIPLDIELVLNNQTRNGIIKSDLTNAELDFNHVGFTKNIGRKSDFTADFVINKDKNSSVKNFAFNFYPGYIKGALEFDNNSAQVKNASPINISLDKNVFTVNYNNLKNSYNLLVQGESLNLSKADLGQFFNQKGNSPLKKQITFNIKKLLMKNNETFSNAVGRIECNHGICSNITFVARLKENNFIRLNWVPEGNKYKLSINSDNAAAFLSGMNIYNNIKKGNLTIIAESDDMMLNKRIKLNGKMILENFTATKNSILAKIVTLSSLTGIIKILSNEISFSKLKSDFTYENNNIKIKNAKTKGTEIGITAEGNVNLNTNYINLQGEVIPSIYGLNPIITKIPFIGKMLGGGQDTGLIVANYTIKGQFNKVNTVVNPLSIFTLGFLRNFFPWGKKAQQ